MYRLSCFVFFEWNNKELHLSLCFLHTMLYTWFQTLPNVSSFNWVLLTLYAPHSFFFVIFDHAQFVCVWVEYRVHLMIIFDLHQNISVKKKNEWKNGERKKMARTQYLLPHSTPAPHTHTYRARKVGWKWIMSNRKGIARAHRGEEPS